LDEGFFSKNLKKKLQMKL